MYEAILSLLRNDSNRESTRRSDSSEDWSSSAALVNGYREYGSASASRLAFRWGFRTLVRLACGDLGVRDTQCGFKLMTASAGRDLYSDLNLAGWSHDVEVLYRARDRAVSVTEVTVPWRDVKGSKLTASPGGLPVVIARMLFDIVWLRLAYATGKWR